MCEGVNLNQKTEKLVRCYLKEGRKMTPEYVMINAQISKFSVQHYKGRKMRAKDGQE